MSGDQDITPQLCRWITELKAEDIPSDTLDRAKRLILDGIACALVGAHLPWSETATKAVSGIEGPGKCTVIGWGNKQLGPLPAALLNSTYIQGFELDDVYSSAPMHVNSILIPSLLAAVDHNEGPTLSGLDFLKSYVVGAEIGPRIGLALHGPDLLTRGWHSGAIQGPGASASAVSSLLHLDASSTESALGIACTQACGLMAAQFGSMAKRMQHGFAARNGLLGVYLAKEGYTGIQNVFEVPYGGFLNCFGQGANFEPKTLPEELVKGLGSKWELLGIKNKLHAAMFGLHGAIEAVAELQKAYPDRFAIEELGEIAKIETLHSGPAYEHGGWEMDLSKPISSTGAQMSVQYVVSAQLLDGQVLMQQFAPDKIERPEILKLIPLVEPKHEGAYDASNDKGWNTKVIVHFKDGLKVEQFLAAPEAVDPGCSAEDILEKWRLLTRNVITEEQRDKIEKMVVNLEKLGDARDLSNALRIDTRSLI